MGDYIYFCDMDGVLANFHSGAVKACNEVLDLAGQAYQELSIEGVFASSSVRRAVRRIWKDHGKQFRLATDEDLKGKKGVKMLSYAVAGQDVYKFFRNLEPYADGMELWEHLNGMTTTGGISLLSAPLGDEEMCRKAKVEWAIERLKPKPFGIIVVPAKDKPNFSEEGAVLIDDRQSTIDAWDAAGGIGILHEPGNSAKTIEALEALE
jgi:beta-phosphoglucomutase-like phosphatase (HAD superfamily)